MKRGQVQKVGSKVPTPKKSRSQYHSPKNQGFRFSVAAENQNLELRKAVHLLAESKSKLKKDDKKFVIATLKEISESRGLPPNVITKIMKYLGNFDDLSLQIQLVSFLVPQSKVPEDAVITLIYYLTLLSFHVKLKTKLLDWVLTYYNDIESYENILALYEVLFILLDSDVMRPPLCKLLCAMTTRDSVKPQRIKYLLELQMKVGCQPAILALLNAYQTNKPEYRIGIHDSKKVFTILRAVPRLRSERDKLQHRNEDHILDETKDSSLFYSMDIKTYKDFNECLESLQGIQGLEVLAHSQIRRILLTSGGNDDLIIRFMFYLRSKLSEEKNSKRVLMMQHLPKPVGREITEIDILPTIAKLNFELQGGVPETTNFLCRVLKVWDGNSGSDILFQLIPYWEICSFATLMNGVLQPLFKHFCVGSVLFQCQVIQCLTEMYKNWMLFEARLYTESTRQLICQGKSAEFDPYKEIKELAQHLDKLCIISLTINPTHPPFLLSQVLESYQTMVLVHSYNEHGILPLPSSSIICASVLSTNANVLEQLCSLILSYKQEIGRMKEHSIPFHIDIDQLNIYINYIFETLWNCQYFVEEIFTSNVKPKLRSTLIKNEKSLFHIHKNPNFILTMKENFTNIDLEVHNNKISPDNDFFLCLASNGFPAVSDFMYTFVRRMDEGEGEDYSETE